MVATEFKLERPNEFATISAEWVEACDAAMQKCPAEFVAKFTQIMFIGQRLITETRVRAQMNAATEELLRQGR